MKWIIIYSLFLVALIGVLVTGRRRAPTGRPPSVPVSRIQPSIFAPGRVEGISAEIELFASIQEPVAALSVREGESVRAGDLLVQLDDGSYTAAVELGRAGVQLAEAELNRLQNGPLPSEIEEFERLCEARYAELVLANQVYQRGLLLAPTQSISQYELDENQASAASSRAHFEASQAKVATISAPARQEDLSIAEAKVASAYAKLRIAEAALARTQLVAPRDGVVLQINVEVGELQADKPMIVLSDTQSLFVRASVDEFDALHVAVGQAVRMTTNAIPDRIFYGHISRISPKMDHKEIVSERLDSRMDTRAREIWVKVESDSPLIIGLPMELWIGEENSPAESRRAARTDSLRR